MHYHVVVQLHASAMYRPQEDQCPADCLQVVSNFLSAAQAYIAHLGTLRPNDRFKKDDDLSGASWVLASTHPAQGFPQHHPYQPPQQGHPDVYDVYRHGIGMVHVAPTVVRDCRTGSEASSSMIAQECAPDQHHEDTSTAWTP